VQNILCLQEARTGYCEYMFVLCNIQGFRGGDYEERERERESEK
jgi:hypothetical protein